MISMDEILKGQDEQVDVKNHFPNLQRLHYVSNYIRRLYAKPLIVTSGFRSMDDHLRIYRERGIAEEKVPMGSMHLRGAAIDFSDPDKKLQKWIAENMRVSEILDVYYESFDATPNWVHLQIFPPMSRNRFFQP